MDPREEGVHKVVVSAGLIPAHRPVKYTVLEGPSVRKRGVTVGVIVRFWTDEIPTRLIEAMQVSNESLQAGLKLETAPEAPAIATIFAGKILVESSS
ncbi:MAG: hypothetical protein M3Y07_10750 [Acidobacteriota bacterium]|nr:hypothetical protein [Acidobacteriota bacterium]